MSANETQGASATAVRPKAAKKVRGPRAKRVELTPEQRELTERYLPLAGSLAKPIKLKWSEHRDDIDATARLALVEAAQAYNPRLGVKFATFARLRIIGAVRDLERYLFNKAYPRQLPNVARAFHYVPGDVEGGMLMLMSREGTVGADVESTDEVERWLDSLPPRHAQACREMYVAGLTQAETGRRIGLVKSRVCTLHAEALELLRNSPAVREAALAIGLDVGRN
ncbi:MAG TPA: sigma-70 family RNA polymerase sigma factor [Isosphaeraceae bacterium]|jgi:RNA polymerase sigma factor (sigma-70 family)